MSTLRDDAPEADRDPAVSLGIDELTGHGARVGRPAPLQTSTRR